MQKNDTGPFSYTIHNIQLKIMKELNVRPETIKLLEENMGSGLLDMDPDNDFFKSDTKSKSNKSKN